jgi:hypothetical protein
VRLLLAARAAACFVRGDDLVPRLAVVRPEARLLTSPSASKLSFLSAATCCTANALLDRGYGKPTQPISQTFAKIDPSSISDEELAAIAMNGISVNAQAH